MKAIVIGAGGYDRHGSSGLHFVQKKTREQLYDELKRIGVGEGDIVHIVSDRSDDVYLSLKTFEFGGPNEFSVNLTMLGTAIRGVGGKPILNILDAESYANMDLKRRSARFAIVSWI